MWHKWETIYHMAMCNFLMSKGTLRLECDLWGTQTVGSYPAGSQGSPRPGEICLDIDSNAEFCHLRLEVVFFSES